ncbi:MAG: DUF4142 domain-containing protein [Vitreimonas sp.]
MKPAVLVVASFAIALNVPVAQAQPAQARHFLVEAIQGDNSEITLGSLAERRGAAPGVRRFGAMLVRDHSHARSEAVRVARRLGIRPPASMMPQASRERARLLRLRGRAFDREFVRYMVNDHREDIDKFEEQARDRGQVAQLAERTLPALRQHLQTAQSLERQLG